MQHIDASSADVCLDIMWQRLAEEALYHCVIDLNSLSMTDLSRDWKKNFEGYIKSADFFKNLRDKMINDEVKVDFNVVLK